MDEPRRNDAFDQELRRAFAAGGGAPSGPHVDAEVAAAWIEHRLDAPARLAVEAHLADCFDCQAMLATLARISPEGGTVRGESLAWWRRLRAGWLVPATVAAAAALVIWVAVPQQRRASQSAESFTPSPSAPSVATKPDAAAPLSEPAEAERKALSQQPAPAAAPPRTTAVPPPSATLERRDQLADASAPPLPSPAPAPVPPPPPAAESDKASAKLEAERPAVDAQRDNRITVTGETPAAPASPRQEAAAGATARALDSSTAQAALRRANALLIVAADGAARWQRSGGTIEFAPRGDVPFTAATMPVASDAIAAGSAPGGTVCWFVGRGGLVLVSSDGLRFVRVSAPASIDFVAVTATGARGATVTAAGGRRFRTTDQGASWTPQ